MTLIEPNPRFVRSVAACFDNDPEIGAADKIVDKVFQSLPHNRDIEDVWQKVVVLNGLYSTNIYATYAVARHICELNIDSDLHQGSLDLVHRIARVTLNGKVRNNYSFASKYCSWHRPDVYPIYDGFVGGLIWAYRKHCQFADFKQKELGDYPRFRDIIVQFMDHFGLGQFGFKELDKFLWLYGKYRDDIFKKYGLEHEVP